MRAQERLERAAHEGAHAVTAAALGIHVASVTIRSDGHSHGSVEVADDGSVEARAILRLAGREALLLHRLPVRGCGRDLKEARALAVEHAGEANADRQLADWQAQTRALLLDWGHWTELGDVMLALLERGGSLTGSELGSVLYWARTRAA